MIVSDEGSLCNNKTSQSWENKKQNNQMTAERVIRHWGFENSPLPHTTRWKLDLICYGEAHISLSDSALALVTGHQNTSTLSVITMIHDTWSADDRRHYQQIKENHDIWENNHRLLMLTKLGPPNTPTHLTMFV